MKHINMKKFIIIRNKKDPTTIFSLYLKYGTIIHFCTTLKKIACSCIFLQKCDIQSRDYSQNMVSLRD